MNFGISFTPFPQQVSVDQASVNFGIPFTPFPQQVSVDQASEDKSEIAFSNGAFYSLSGDERYHLTTNNTSERHETTRFEPTEAHRPNNPAKHQEYTDYNQRLESYTKWPLNKPDAVSLCDAGFFYSNQDNLVRCFQCSIGLKDFSEEDDPLLEHVRHSPNCPFLVNILGTERLSAIKIKCQTLQSAIINQYQQQQLFTNFQCRHPEYNTVQARLSSFAGWPRHMIQTPLELAEAGLYYTGFEDQVRCFMCDGGLRRWDPEDVPWTEHCRWFPKCPFAREMKGQDFIAFVQASAEYTGGENESATNYLQMSDTQNITNTMEHMTLRDPTFRAAMQEHKNTCLEMGFPQTDINAAVDELIKMGNVKPALEELLDTIDVLKERKLCENSLHTKLTETPFEENQRLKSLIICMQCGNNNVNALFLPCTHHRMCMECAEQLEKCPVCEKFIRQKIRTYLA